jgi:hypothetical protein
MNDGVDGLARRLEHIRRRIAAACGRVGRDPAAVTLLAVSKAVAAERVAEAVDLGLTDFGESYIQEAVDKIAMLADRSHVRWHFIGHLQRNKAKLLDQRWTMLHSLDSLALAHRLGSRPGRSERPLPVLIQVRLGGEETKAGVAPEGLTEFIRQAGDIGGISLAGLMTIPPPVADPEENRTWFCRLRQLRDRLRDAGLVDTERFVHLSMGMSDDFEPAIEEGATIIRVGTALFGPRADKTQAK